MAASVKASPQGLVSVEIARKRRGWTKTAPQWAVTAGVSGSTLKRFWSGMAISQDAFASICKAVDLDWQEVTELGTQHLCKLLTEGVEPWNEWKCLNPPLGYNLNNVNLSNTDLRGIDFSETSLRNANLSGANLENANLSRADLTSANFNGANLRGANLTATRALSSIFTGAILTGACLQDWNINQTTRLENIACDYIFLKHAADSSSRRFIERRPISGNFASGEFTALFQKVLETVDLIFTDGVDWQAFFLSFQQLQEKYNNSDQSVQRIQKKGDGASVIRLDGPLEVNRADIESHAKALYEEHVRSLATRYEAELALRTQQIEVMRQENLSLLNLIKQLAERPLNVVVEASSGSQSTTINFGGDVFGSVNVELENQIQDFAGINFGGDVHGSVNISNQARSSEVAEEIHSLLRQITLDPTIDRTMISARLEQEIQCNPNLKARILNILNSTEAKEIEAFLPRELSAQVLQNLLETNES